MTNEKRSLLWDELDVSSLSSNHKGTGFSPPYTFCTTSFTSYETTNLKISLQGCYLANIRKSRRFKTSGRRCSVVG
jgi:hypothetical protein